MSKNFDETVRLQFKKGEEWIQEIREGLHRIAESKSSAHRQASLSDASFRDRNECPRTHCSQIAQEKKNTVSDGSARGV